MIIFKEILCLLYLNDTNKDIAKLYLNQDFIKSTNLLSFNEKGGSYKYLFYIDEINKIKTNIQLTNEKSKFINFLNDLKMLIKMMKMLKIYLLMQY